jgi:hypothetical protein
MAVVVVVVVVVVVMEVVVLEFEVVVIMVAVMVMVMGVVVRHTLLVSLSSHFISSSAGTGRMLGFALWSVVPTTTWSSQGRKKRKRPSEVFMSTIPTPRGA